MYLRELMYPRINRKFARLVHMLDCMCKSCTISYTFDSIARIPSIHYNVAADQL
jgi:hypothetical protein